MNKDVERVLMFGSSNHFNKCFSVLREESGGYMRIPDL
jgi:hypothetical protein